MADPGVTRPRHLRPLCAFATENTQTRLIENGRTDGRSDLLHQPGWADDGQPRRYYGDWQTAALDGWPVWVAFAMI